MDSTAAEVRQAYKRWLLTAHPDKGGDPLVFIEVREIWLALMSSWAKTQFVCAYILFSFVSAGAAYSLAYEFFLFFALLLMWSSLPTSTKSTCEVDSVL